MSCIVHWFRRDLRLTDNAALYQAGQDAETVIPIFCFDPAILNRDDVGAPCIQFMLDSLEALGKNLEAVGSRLIIRDGNPLEELPRLVKESGARAVYWNRDYEPFAFVRDRGMEERGAALGFETRSFKDSVMHEYDELRTGAGGIYTVFTPYSRNWRSQSKTPVLPRFKARKAPPIKLASNPLHSLSSLGRTLTATVQKGGERLAHDLLKSFLSGPGTAYARDRDYPGIEGSSRLSAHLRFGTISSRTVYWAAEKLKNEVGGDGAKNLDVFINELIWRDFYFQILANFPAVATGAFRPEYNALPWSVNESHFAAWCEGRTGYPIVDAAMRQLNQTGWMHNRLRMVSAMFLTKDLLLSWQWGEKYFMQKLADGELSANNGGWQWSASTGTDAAPYFRIFAPVSQSKKFDADGAFIRKYVPELSTLDARQIHAPWESVPLQLKSLGYPMPIVDHSAQRLKAIAMFKKQKVAPPGTL